MYGYLYSVKLAIINDFMIGNMSRHVISEKYHAVYNSLTRYRCLSLHLINVTIAFWVLVIQILAISMIVLTLTRTIDKRLKELGAKRATPVALTDEATGLEDVVEPYVESIFTEFNNYFYNNKDELKHIEFPIPLIIMYGSATGNGEWISGDIFNKSLELIAKDDNTLFSILSEE